METGIWTRRTTLGLTIIAIVYLAFHATVSVFLALEHATAFNGYAMNGAFQLYNPLRRLGDGQVPGVDFPFFHGVGVPVLHYPLYAVLGGGIFGAELARWLISPLLFGVTGYVFFRVLLGSWQRAFIALALYLAIVIPRVNNIIDPGNSLMGIRTMTPLIIAACLIAAARRPRLVGGMIDVQPTLLVAYGFIGIGVALGTEQGLAAAGAFLLVRFVVNWRRLGLCWRLIAQTAADTVGSLVSILATISLLTLGHPIETLRYALLDVPSDQGWVFGAVPNVTLTWDSLVWELIGGGELNLSGEVPRYWLTAIAAVILLVVAIVLRVVSQREIASFAFLWIYGIAVLISMLGYINLADQLAPFGRVSAAIGAGLAVLVGLTLLARGEHVLADRRAGRGGPWSRAVVRLVAASCLALVSLMLLLQATPARAAQLAEIPKRTAIEKALTGPWGDYDVSSPGWRANLDQFEPLIPEGASIWSTYSSLYESTRGTFNPAPGGEDYIIHALGAEGRAAYEQAFISDPPDAVITMNPFYSFYEEWLWNRYPHFYATLLADYQIASISASHILWLPADASTEQSDLIPAQVGADGTVRLPANDSDETQYYAVTVSYDADGGSMPVANRLPRYYLVPSGAALGLYGLALPPYEGEWTVIVPVLADSGEVTLTPTLAGISRFAELTIESAQYRVLDTPSANAQLADMNYCFWNREAPRCEG